MIPMLYYAVPMSPAEYHEYTQNNTLSTLSGTTSRSSKPPHAKRTDDLTQRPQQPGMTLRFPLPRALAPSSLPLSGLSAHPRASIQDAENSAAWLASIF
jgi:hypothetical protein